MDGLLPGSDLSQIPLASNPNGTPPNFINPPSLITAVRSVGITLNVISLILVLLRVVIYHRVKRPFGMDDGLYLSQLKQLPLY